MMMDDSILQPVQALSQRLISSNAMLTTVESCTGGGVAYALTALPGSSEFFSYGFVTYANEAKSSLTAVPADLLEKYGAVSEQVAAAMATGGLDAAKADYAIAVTGIAGPSGGSDLKPVGTVFFAWSDKIGRVKVVSQLFEGGREQIRTQAIAFAINGLIAFIDEYQR